MDTTEIDREQAKKIVELCPGGYITTIRGVEVPVIGTIDAEDRKKQFEVQTFKFGDVITDNDSYE